jgi:hypothetical protein
MWKKFTIKKYGLEKEISKRKSLKIEDVTKRKPFVGPPNSSLFLFVIDN